MIVLDSHKIVFIISPSTEIGTGLGAGFLSEYDLKRAKCQIPY